MVLTEGQTARWDRMKHPEKKEKTLSCFSQLIFDKDAKTIQHGKE